jgi:hypothetical protein
MTGWPRASGRRPSPRVRPIALAALLVGALALALVPAQPGGAGNHRLSTRARTLKRGGPRRPPVPPAQLARVRRAARSFLVGYLRFVYGRASAASVRALAPALRSELILKRAQVPPVARRRHPRLVALTALGQASGDAVALALVDDGGIANYAVRLTVRRTSRGWLVSRVDGG